MRLRNVNYLLFVCLAMGCKKPQPATIRTASPTVAADVAVVAEAQDVEAIAHSIDTDASVALVPAIPGSNGCQLIAPPTIVGQTANVTSLTFQRFNLRVNRALPELILSWTVPPLYAHGGDDLAAFKIEYGFLPHESERFTFTVPTLLDAEERSNARGLTRSPVNIMRVFARSIQRGNTTSFTLATDQLARDDDGNELVEAGDMSVMSATIGDSSSDQTLAKTIVVGAPIFARTVFAAAHPFVLGLRGATTDNMVGNSVSFFVTRAATPPTNHASDFWPLTIDPAAIRRARNPVQALRDQLPDAFETTEVPGRGFVVVFRHDRKLWLGWLSTALAPMGDLLEIPVLAQAPGRPRVTTDGSHVVVVFADRAATPDGGPPAHYRLRGASLEFASREPITARELAVPTAGDMDDFAPFATTMEDHSWVISWTRGHADDAFSARGMVLLQSFDAAFNVRGATVVVSDSDGGSDARILTAPRGVVVVAFASGTGNPRKVSVSASQCALPQITPAANADAGTNPPDA